MLVVSVTEQTARGWSTFGLGLFWLLIALRGVYTQFHNRVRSYRSYRFWKFREDTPIGVWIQVQCNWSHNKWRSVGIVFDGLVGLATVASPWLYKLPTVSTAPSVEIISSITALALFGSLAVLVWISEVEFRLNRQLQELMVGDQPEESE